MISDNLKVFMNFSLECLTVCYKIMSIRLNYLYYSEVCVFINLK